MRKLKIQKALFLSADKELRFITAEAVQTGRAEVSNKGKRRAVFLPDKLRRLLKAYLQNKKSPPERCLSVRTEGP